MEREPSLLESILLYKWHILGTAVVVAVLALGLSFLQSPSYTTRGDLVLSDPANVSALATAVRLSPEAKRHVAEQSGLLGSPAISMRASEILGGSPDWRKIQESVEITPSPASDAIAIVASQPTADGAVALANALVQAYEEFVVNDIQTKVDASIQVLEKSRENLQTELDAVGVALETQGGDGSSLPSQIGTPPAENQEELLATVLGAAGPALERMGENADLAIRQSTLLNLISGINTQIRSLENERSLYGAGVKYYLEPTVPDDRTQPKPLRNAAIVGALALIAMSAWAWWRTGSVSWSGEAELPASTPSDDQSDSESVP